MYGYVLKHTLSLLCQCLARASNSAMYVLRLELTHIRPSVKQLDTERDVDSNEIRGKRTSPVGGPDWSQRFGDTGVSSIPVLYLYS